MVKEKIIQPPKEEVAKEELVNINKVDPADKKKQDDYEKRLNLFLKGFRNLEEKYKIKFLQVPARIIYNDTKYDKNN